MNKKVTIQDIADALGVSRNTVSKAINNSDGLAEATREKILQKAIEMGYKQFSYVADLMNSSMEAEKENTSEAAGEIALLTPAILRGNHFASLFLDKFHREIAQLGYTMGIYRITLDELQKKKLPALFDITRIKAIVCVEVFDNDYADMLCETEVPVLFVDAPCRAGRKYLQADILLMDNTSEIMYFIHEAATRGLTKIGFIGEYTHCQSFFERYCAFRNAMMMENLPVDEKYIIRYRGKDVLDLADIIEPMEDLPELFICANDFFAIDAMQILAQKDRKLLKKCRFLGFDDTHESRIFYPSLSTVHIHTQAMAYSAVSLLVTRIKEPSMDVRTAHVACDLVLRDSTEF